MADFSLSDMPWLTQHEPPSVSLARGASVGSVIAQRLSQRESLAQRRMEFEQQQRMAQREMSLQEKIAPLREKALSMALEKDSLELNELQRQLNLRESNAKSYDELANFITSSVQAGNAATPDVTLGVVSILSRNPTLLEDQRAQSLMKYFNGAVELGLKQKEMEALTGLRVRREANAETRLRNEQARLTLQQQGFSLRQIDQMMQAAEQGYEITGTGTAPVAPATAPTPDTAAAPAPSASAPSPSIRPIQRPPTTGTVTKAQQDLFSAEEALRSLNSAASAIIETPQAIGVRGALGELAEKAQGQLNPTAPLETPITDARQKASIAFSRIAESLRVDSGNMSKYELNKLEQAGDVLGLEEAPQTALRKLQNLQAAVIGRKLRNLKLTRAKPDDAFLRQIPATELPGLRSDGLLSLEDALRWYELE